MVSLPKPTQAASYSALADSQVEAVLFKHGYLTESVISLAESGSVPFVQASTKQGDTCYVKIDRPNGGISFESGNRTNVTIATGSSILQSTKVDTMACAGSEVCGVAFQCEGELCISQRGVDGVPVESTFVTVSKPTDAVMTRVGSPVAYPVVTLSEIEADPAGTLKRIREATVRIQARAIASSETAIHAAVEESVRLQKYFTDLEIAIRKMHEFRNAEVKVRIARWYEYNALPTPMSAANEAQFKTLVDTLRNLSFVFAQLISFTGNFERFARKHLGMLTGSTRDAFYSLFTTARRNFTTQISGPLLNPIHWSLPAAVDAVDFSKSTATNLVDAAGQKVILPAGPAVDALLHSMQ